jgi:hypothetical protein
VNAIRTIAIANCVVTKIPLKENFDEGDFTAFFRLSTAFDFDIFQEGIRLKRELIKNVNKIEIAIKPGEWINCGLI